MKKECPFISEINQKDKNRTSLTSFIILLILFLILCSNSFAQDADNTLEKIKTQIHILNLLNGLELNNQQMQLILGAVKEAQEIRIKAKEAISQKEEITKAYQEVLRVAKTGSLVIPQDIAFRVHKVNQEVDKIKKVAQDQLTALALKIKNSLRPYQIYVLDDYKPCIIPPVKKGRVGQAADAGGFVKVLERVHIMPKDQYFLRRDRIVQEEIDKVKTKVPLGFILDEERLKTQLRKAMDDVRLMSDADFVIKKEEIAENIKAQLLPAKPPVNIGVKIERFLLQPEIISILEERIISLGSSIKKLALSN